MIVQQKDAPGKVFLHYTALARQLLTFYKNEVMFSKNLQLWQI